MLTGPGTAAVAAGAAMPPVRREAEIIERPRPRADFPAPVPHDGRAGRKAGQKAARSARLRRPERIQPKG